ncbi:MAG TPA: hypothetical protein VEQ15_00380 [Myxococcales bacterium]|nr:hypothetical protein [Myxococcales bacterium]
MADCLRDLSHGCPGPGCGRRVAGDQLACRVHWFQVPEPLRLEVWRTWRAFTRELDEGGGSLDEAAERHQVAMRAAIATMREKS